MRKFEFHIERTNFGRNVSLHLARPMQNGSTQCVATAVKFEDVPEGEYRDPFLSITPDDAQALIDGLWSVGFRPTEGSGSAGSLAATERHLKDMQKIAFKLLDVGDGKVQP